MVPRWPKNCPKTVSETLLTSCRTKMIHELSETCQTEKAPTKYQYHLTPSVLSTYAKKQAIWAHQARAQGSIPTLWVGRVLGGPLSGLVLEGYQFSAENGSTSRSKMLAKQTVSLVDDIFHSRLPVFLTDGQRPDGRERVCRNAIG